MSPSRGISGLCWKLAQHGYTPRVVIPLISSRRWASTVSSTSLLERLAGHDSRSTAVVNASSNQSYTYGRLLRDVIETKEKLKERGAKTLYGERLAFLTGNEYNYVVALLSIMASGAIAVPLAPAFPTTELQTILNDCSASMILSSKDYHEKASEIVHAGLKNPPVLETMNQSTTHPLTNSPLEMPAFETSLDIDRSGLMLYTSGTTGRPKGVLLPQAALMAQCRSLVEAWKYSANDYLLHILPLHHIHGIINGLLAPLLAGSSIEFLYPFNPTSVWHRLAAPYLPKTPQQQSRKITIFTAVPTMYNRLLPTFPELPTDIQEAAIEAISPDNLRLNMSGSSALPTSIKTAWTKLSKGNVLLERYGMTEIGMALSCGMDMSERLDGSVGWPLPSVDVGLLDTETNEIIPPNGKNLGNEREGEIIVNGPTVFQEYWRKEDKTRESFVIDKETGKKWFKTGDIAVRKNVVNPVTGKLFEKGPMYFIRGRKDVDIIKTGGEKVSALEVERELLSLPGIAEVAVVAVPSTIWGQKVAAVIVLDDTRSITNTTSETPAKSQWTPVEIRRALKDRLANFKIPQMMKILKGRGEELPRNVMGKVNKKNLVEHYWGSSEVDATEK